MATLVLQGVGRVIGNFVGWHLTGSAQFAHAAMRVGGAAGAIAGLYVDSRIIGALTPSQKIEGPLLDELRVTSSTEGAVIPRVYGSFRLGGNLIWATDFRMEESTEDVGGKGGPSVEVTNRRYFCSFAVGLCEGPIAGLGRIWADGKPFDVENAVYRVYLGTEDQLPDEAMEAVEGDGEVPAYRGLAYVVFDDLPLESFGNRIPQLSFEVFAPLEESGSARELVTSVNLIPSAGEFVYATEQVLEDLGYGNTRAINCNAEPRPDILVSLDQLEAQCPNIESVSLVVSWFGDDLRCGSCLIRPGVEQLGKLTSPVWTVDGVARTDAYEISRVDPMDAESGPNYGGTPSDRGVVQAIRELKARGLRVTFYPFVLMDVPPGNNLPNPYSDNPASTGQPAFPWRGRITCSPAAGFEGTADQTETAETQVAAFFGGAEASDFTVTPASAPEIPTVAWAGGSDWGFRRMILHYAHLCAQAGGVDAFLIGSELRGLTQIRSSASDYPAVAQLVELLEDVRAIFDAAGQTSTEISYAADWSEYFGHQPADGSGDVFFHLDPLWSHDDCDFVGIDNYVPLSDWRDGTTHLDWQAGVRSIYDLDYLRSNIEGGEGFDWFYADQAARDAQTRTTITDSEGKPWVFRYKDHRSWWANEHYDRPGGVESESPTDWVSESKPIRYTEVGCPAIDKGTNQPNVFFDPKSWESFLPYYSRAGGVRDDAMQRAYLEALLGYWGDELNNPMSGVYAGRMIHPDISVWTWDARPYPAFPAREDVWSDGPNWRLGHWLTGRMSGSRGGTLVEALCARAGVAAELVDASELVEVVEGYAVTAIESARASIAPLMVVYGFDAVETGGVVRFVPRGGQPALTLSVGQVVAAPEPSADDIVLARGQETELARALKWRFLRGLEEYGAHTVEARRITVDTARIAAEQYPIVIEAASADAKVRRTLAERWLERETASLTLPPSRLALDASDVVTIDHDGRTLQYRLAAVTDGEARRAELVRADAALYTLRPGPESPPSLPPPVVLGPPAAALMDLPQLSEGVSAHQSYVAVAASPWYGRAAVYRSLTSSGFTLVNTVSRPARIGTLAFDFFSWPGSRWDRANELWVNVPASVTLASVTELEQLGGANTIAVESSAGVWEVLSFGVATLVEPGRYRCTRLLRGLLGTEDRIAHPASAGARVVLLDAAVTPLAIGAEDVGLAWNWRTGPAQHPPSAETYVEAAFTPQGRGAAPYAPVHLRTTWQGSDILLSWIRRTRARAGDLWAPGEVPLGEQTEEYRVEILDGVDVVRTVVGVPVQAYLYTAALQTADWGGLQTSLTWRVAQVGQFGPGVFAGHP